MQANDRAPHLFIDLVVAGAMAFYCLPSSALCVQPAAEGSWLNADSQTRGNTRADLRFTCQDQILNGQPYPPGPPWHMRLWGKCSPKDCDWGEIGADEVLVGDRQYIHGTYRFGFGTVNVYAAVVDGRLWMWTWTDFSDPARADYPSQHWFVKH